MVVPTQFLASSNNFSLPFTFSTECLARCHFLVWHRLIFYDHIRFYFPKAQEEPKIEIQRNELLILALVYSVALNRIGPSILSLQSGNDNTS